jgi:hypothetical protein
MAFEFVKAMRADGLECGEGYRPLARRAYQFRSLLHQGQVASRSVKRTCVDDRPVERVLG